MLRKSLLALSLFLAACPQTQVIPPPDPNHLPRLEGGKKDWTILVYMAADQDDLKPFAYMNLYEMESPLVAGEHTAGSTATTNLVVQLDTPGLTGLRRVEVKESAEPYNTALDQNYWKARAETDLRSKVVQVLDEPEHATAADAAQDLKSFLHWGVTTYPARHYMIVVWGHGRGFAAAQAANAAPNPGVLRGIAADQTQGNYLDTPLLRDTLSQVVREDLGGRPFDIYASDACLMQSVEVATELAPVARFIVGSAQIQPFSGLPYRQLLHALSSGRFADKDPAPQKPHDQAYELARILPSLAESSLRGDGLQARLTPDAKKSFTLSALRTSDVKNGLVPALYDVAQKLAATIDAQPVRGVELGTRIQRMPSFLGGATDIGYFLTRMRDTLFVNNYCRIDELGGEEVATCSDKPTTALLVSLGRAQQALSQAVVSTAYGDDYAPTTNPSRMAGFTAVSVWLPRSNRDYANRIKDFSTSTFYKSGPWSSFLSKIFDPQAAN